MGLKMPKVLEGYTVKVVPGEVYLSPAVRAELIALQRKRQRRLRLLKMKAPAVRDFLSS
jgi:hypothetical protein